MNKQVSHIPSGYKPSPLGPIPEDWEVKRLGEVVTVNSGKDYKHLSTGNIPVYGTGGYMLSVNDRLSDIDAVGIGRKGTIDKPQYLRAPFWTVDTLFFLTTKENYDLRFVFNLSQLVEWKKYSEQTGVPSLTSKSINNIQIPVPHLPEQQRIVSVLSLWDTAIAKQTVLIEKLTLRKRGLMQQLLTGKKRLKGFEGNSFKMMSFDKIANTFNVKAFQVSKSDYQEKGKTPIVDQGQTFIAAYSDSDKIFTDVPFILFGDHTRTIKWIDFQCVIGADGVQAIKPKEGLYIKYLYYLLSNTELPNLGYSRHMSILKEKVFYVSTDIDEQKAIAGCLSNADKEIEIQKQKLAAMQAQKKGLMQVLLTGKKRIN